MAQKTETRTNVLKKKYHGQHSIIGPWDASLCRWWKAQSKGSWCGLSHSIITGLWELKLLLYLSEPQFSYL